MISVIIADDHAVVRTGLAALLETEGDIEVVGLAQDGIEAVDIAARLRPDIAIIDLQMPRMNGLVLLDNLRHMEKYATVPVIAVSADLNPAVVDQFKKSGVSAFIAKGDFKRGNLINAVKELVNE